MKRCLTSLIIRECKSKPQWKSTSHLLEWLCSKRQKVKNIGEVLRKGNSALRWECKLVETCGKQSGSSSKIKNKTTIWHSNPTSACVLVCLGCCNKISHTGWLRNSKHLFLTIPEGGCLRPRCQRGGPSAGCGDFSRYPHIKWKGLRVSVMPLFFRH